MSCDLCDKKGPTKATRIEGTVYQVCSACASFGSDVKVVHKRRRQKKGPDTSTVRANAGQLIRSVREKQGKSHKEFAHMLNIKESLLQHWETGKVIPLVDQARKLERMLHISLVQAATNDEDYTPTRSGGGALTIGDLLKK